MRKIIEYFINNTLLVNLVTIFILVAGLLSILQLRREAYRSVDEKEMEINTEYPGASPKDVELNVTKPIEDALNEISGIDSYKSTTLENYSSIRIILDKKAKDVEKIKSDIRRAVDTITEIPKEAKKPKIIEIKSSETFEIMNIGVFSESISQHDLVNKTRDLKRRLLAIPYVSKVETPDMRDREVQIKLDTDKLNKYYISFDEVIEKIKNRNIEVTGGTLESYILEKTIITLSKFENIDDVKDVIIRSNYDGKQIYLKDVTKIIDTFEKPYTITKYNGKRGLSLEVFKKESADVITMTDSVYKLLDEYKRNISDKELSIEIISDEAEITRNLLNIVYDNAIIGFILVLATLFLFMNFKNAFWTASGIPIALSFAFIFFPKLGITINSISLMGIIIMLGIVVDDAIIVSENIYRYNLENKSGLNGAISATTEMTPSIIAAVLTTIVAFLPILFWQSLEAEFAKEIPITVIFILIGSLVESLLILPNHIIHKLGKILKSSIGFFVGLLFGMVILKRYFPQLSEIKIVFYLLLFLSGIIVGLLFIFFYRDHDNAETLKERRFIKILKKGYSYLLTPVLKFRYLTVFVFILLTITIIYLLGINGKIRFEMFPDNDINEFWVSGNIKEKISLKYTSDVISDLEKYIEENYYKNSVRSIISRCGSQGRPEYFSINIIMNTKTKNRKYSADEIINNIRDKMNEQDLFTETKIRKNTGSPDYGRDLEFQIIGNDDNKRKELSDKIENYLIDINNIIDKKNRDKRAIIDIDRSDNDLKNEVIIMPKHLKDSRLGISPSSIANSIRIAYDGYIVTDLKTNDETINYRLILDEKYRENISTLNDLKVLNNNNKLITLSNLVDIKERKSPLNILHFNGEKTTVISADLDSKLLTPQEFFSKYYEKIKTLEKEYPGFRIILKGAAEASNDSMSGLLGTMLIALLLVAFILIFLFKSVFQPIIVLFAIPFGIVGVLVAFFFHGMILSVMAILGIIGLCGVVVNDSLVMVEYMNRLVRENTNEKAITLVIKGAVTRFRPVILTTLTTVAGLFPTAYGLGGRNNMIIPVAMSMSWGLIFSTGLTLILIPCLYLIIHDITTLSKKK